jgi:hypothetical protein
MTPRRDCWMLLAYLVLSLAAGAQMAVSLETADTKLRLEAGINAPSLIALQSGDWKDRAAESPMSNAEIHGRSVQLDV